ncbi:MAG: HNH/ENDO VII family nuclease [Clostridium sp.]|uniref:HNH/ENDO VII family nuclease n=1 Tax=Clostridium sp. TaxID=1506 RepID=UPI003D6CAEA4
MLRNYKTSKKNRTNYIYSNIKGNGNSKAYSNSNIRPKYADGQVEAVWENAKDGNGRVFDPNIGKELFWDKSKPRTGQWDMGHLPGEEYNKLWNDYMEGKLDPDPIKNKQKFLERYRDPNNYQPESINGNRSHKYEQKYSIVPK